MRVCGEKNVLRNSTCTAMCGAKLSVGVEGCAREWMSLPGYTEGAVNICEGQRDTAECFSIGVTTICVNELSLCKSTKVS